MPTENSPVRRCYDCDTHPARYEAHLNYDGRRVVLLCDECAIWERDGESVVWIRTLEVSGAN